MKIQATYIDHLIKLRSIVSLNVEAEYLFRGVEIIRGFSLTTSLKFEGMVRRNRDTSVLTMYLECSPSYLCTGLIYNKCHLSVSVYTGLLCSRFRTRPKRLD